MLKRRWLLNLALFAVVLVLAVSARLEQRQDLLTTTLTSMPVQQIQSLSLKRPGEPRMRLARKDNGWHMLEPFVAPAADAPTTKLLPIAATYVHRTLPAATLDLQRLRLDPAMISLRLDDLELRFGTTEPVHDWRYVQIGDLVHLIDDGFLAQLLAPAQDYLDRRLLPKNFSPGLGNLDGRPIGAGVLGTALAPENLVSLRRRMGYAVQGTGLFPHMTARGNITLAAELAGWSDDAIERRVRELIALMHLEPPLLDRHPHELSGGQQQRVGLCRAMMLRPEVLLLDEPFAAIDPITRFDIHRQLLDVLAAEPATVVLVTHDMREAMLLAEHIVVMHAGQVCAQETPDALRNRAPDLEPELLLQDLLRELRA
jgi:osmoprotectant transport system ATP-binding protein